MYKISLFAFILVTVTMLVIAFSNFKNKSPNTDQNSEVTSVQEFIPKGTVMGVMRETIWFEKDKISPNEENRRRLDKVANFFKKKDKGNLFLKLFEVRSESISFKSKERLHRCTAYLIKKGVKEDRIKKSLILTDDMGELNSTVIEVLRKH